MTVPSTRDWIAQQRRTGFLVLRWCDWWVHRGGQRFAIRTRPDLEGLPVR